MQVNTDYLQSFRRELNIDCSPKVTIKIKERFADVPQSSSVCKDMNIVAVYIKEYSWYDRDSTAVSSWCELCL